MNERHRRGTRLAVIAASALALGGCASPGDAARPPQPARAERLRADRVLTPSAALGDGAGAAWLDADASSLAPVSPADERRRPEFDAAKALLEGGDAAGAVRAYDRIYTLAPRGPGADEALFGLAEATLRSGEPYRADELFERLLREFPATPRYNEAVERVFQIGKLFAEEKAERASILPGFRKKDRTFGIEVLERFLKARDRHELAPQALFTVAEAHLADDEAELAIESWQRLMKEYPRSSWARLAEYRIALAFFSLSYGVVYDKRPILTGLRRLRAYVRRYPTGDNIREAEAKLASVEEELAAHELKVARRYERDDHHVSAQIYLATLRRDYPKTRAAAEAERLAREWPNPPLPPDERDEKGR